MEFIMVLCWEYLVVHCSEPVPGLFAVFSIPDVGRHQRDLVSHWYENAWVSCLSIGRNRNLGTAALKGIQIREKCDTCRLLGVVVLVRCVPVRGKFHVPDVPLCPGSVYQKRRGFFEVQK